MSSSSPMSNSPRPRMFTAGSGDPVPCELTGVRWSDGTIECRFRLTHPAGSLVATDGEVGTILVAPDVSCTVCSAACDT